MCQQLTMVNWICKSIVFFQDHLLLKSFQDHCVFLAQFKNTKYVIKILLHDDNTHSEVN